MNAKTARVWQVLNALVLLSAWAVMVLALLLVTIVILFAQPGGLA